ncbi:hypothetical protein PMIN02_007580 [Paraphaeosphaeria minitans]
MESAFNLIKEYEVVRKGLDIAEIAKIIEPKQALCSARTVKRSVRAGVGLISLPTFHEYHHSLAGLSSTVAAALGNCVTEQGAMANHLRPFRVRMRDLRTGISLLRT